MTKNNRPITRACDLCLYDQIEDYENDFIHKRRTVAEIVDALRDENIDTTKKRFYDHIRYHLKPEVALVYSKNAPELAKEIVDNVGELIDEIERMKNKIIALENSINSDAQPAMIKAYTGMISEFRRLIESLAKIQGELKGATTTYVQNMNVEYDNIKAVVMQDTCSQCKAKLAKVLEPLVTKTDS